MRFQRIIEQVYLKPWLITPSAHAAIRRLVEARLIRQQAGFIEDFVVAREPMRMDGAQIAHIDIRGVIGQGLSKIEKTCGATDTLDVAADIARADAAGARAFLFHFDSPGGSVTGTPELADRIAALPQPKVAVTNSLMASAAYWLASGMDRIIATRSADVGSIGVYIPWIDESALYDAAGLKADPIVNGGGDLKTTFFPGLPMSDEQRAYLQAEVDQTFAEFKAHILAHRAVDEDAMRGQTLFGKNALAANLMDAIGDEADAMAWLTGKLSA